MDVSKLKFRRFRPLRATQADRDRNAEVRLSPQDFIFPFFLVEGTGIRRELPSLHAGLHVSVDQAVEESRKALAAGVDKVLLFGVVDNALKDPLAKLALGDESLVARAVRAIKKAVPGVTVFTDICVCEYTDHGHCGILRGDTVDNDATLPLLADMALAHARAGADYVAPSAMMDGQVAAIRARLDENGFRGTKVLGYSAKYASKMYGPFRDVAGSAPSFGDRKSYQMDPRVRRQGVDEAVADYKEGADWLMVKPATFYLDVIAAVKKRFPKVSLAAYFTSGDLMMVRYAAAAGLFDWKDGLLENLYAIKGAGADFIIAYNAVEVSSWLTGANNGAPQ
jgi:porphobilinogen synthase